VLRLGPLEFDQASRTATVNGAPLRLTLRPAMVLEALMRAKAASCPGRPWRTRPAASRARGAESGAIEVYVNRLRKSLAGPAPGVRIENQRGIGYRIVVEPGP
jgi:DNA-binding response OmpR family regulator